MNRILVILVIVSLAGNAVLLARRFAGPAGIAVSARVEPRSASPDATDAGGAAATVSGPETAEEAGRAEVQGFWRGIDAVDPRRLLADLRAAGFGEDDAKALVRAHIERQFRPRLDAILSSTRDLPYWRSERTLYSDPRWRAQLRQIQREQEAMLRDALGDAGTEMFSVTFSMGAALPPDPKSIPIPEGKQQILARIQRDYMDMTSDIHLDSGSGPIMPWDREKIDYLEAEKRKDIVAALTPGELETYDLHASGTAIQLRRQLGGFDATEAEFRALFAIESDYKPMSPVEYLRSPANPSPGSSNERRERIKAALGEARYADYERVTDPGYQRAREVATRLGLSAESATAAYQLSRDIQRRADELHTAGAMSPEERKAAAAALAREAYAGLETLLTPDGAKAYRTGTGSSWLRAIEARGGIR